MSDVLNLPKSWVQVTIADLGKVVSGGTPSTKENSYWGGNISWISPSDLTGYSNKNIARGAKSITQEGLKKSSATIMPAGSIHFSSRAPIGYTVISSCDMTTNQGFKSLIPAHGVFNEYIYYYFKSAKQLAESKATGTTFKEISGTAFSKLPVPLPPTSEQHRIVAKIEELFSELDKGIENLKTAQAQLKVYRQALLKHAFEGKLTAQWRAENQDKLETAAALQKRIQQERAQRYQQQLADWEANGGSKPKAPKPLPPLTVEELAELPELPEGWGWVRLGDILSVSSGSGLTSSQMNGGTFPVYGGNGISGYHDEYLFENETLILGRVGAKCGVVHITRPKSWITDNALIVEFLIHSLDQRYMKLRLEYLDLNKHSVSTAQPVISGSKIYPLFIGLPCLQEQIEIASQIEARLSEADQLDQTLTISLQQAEALRQSILKKAFSGQLVAQDPHDEPASALLARIKAEQAEIGNNATSPRRTKKVSA